ncbi:hypothetical protein CHU95_00300 [Niveispirillum lacus]|uniref:HTH cro/C1-type domain-containing protein n=1 Tax=Niveispirillum lacus TaxID=1981099 RepID=A0A255Z8J1_9PROT|nr:helix-turn-helix domain-containing protein [Niveispirillum lacus]OYQ37788.1 hypothetical protein CHU95_00300 [Niveispirillum lacus]
MPRRSRNAAANAAETLIETHAAGRIRLRRALLGMSQSDLARALGITFQQVQKYERGSNRVSVGKLYRLADILDVPMMFFFDGLEDAGQRPVASTDTLEQSGILSRRELDLLRAWRGAPPEVADTVSALLRAIEPDRQAEIVPEAVQAATPKSTLTPEPAPQPAAAEAAPPPPPDEHEAPPRRRGRPAGSTNTKPSKHRRPTGAVWNPADIRSYDD